MVSIGPNNPDLGIIVYSEFSQRAETRFLGGCGVVVGEERGEEFSISNQNRPPTVLAAGPGRSVFCEDYSDSHF